MIQLLSDIQANASWGYPELCAARKEEYQRDGQAGSSPFYNRVGSSQIKFKQQIQLQLARQRTERNADALALANGYGLKYYNCGMFGYQPSRFYAIKTPSSACEPNGCAMMLLTREHMASLESRRQHASRRRASPALKAYITPCESNALNNIAAGEPAGIQACYNPHI